MGHFKGFPIGRSVGRLVGLLFLEIFGILEGSFSYFKEFIYRTYKMICTSYGTSRTVNFWNLVLSKKLLIVEGFSMDFAETDPVACTGEDSK